MVKSAKIPIRQIPSAVLGISKAPQFHSTARDIEIKTLPLRPAMSLLCQWGTGLQMTGAMPLTGPGNSRGLNFFRCKAPVNAVQCGAIFVVKSPA